MQKHALLTLLGLLLAALAVAWIQPNTNGGTTFVVVVCVLFANAIGAMAIRPLKKQRDMSKARSAKPAVPGGIEKKVVGK